MIVDLFCLLLYDLCMIFIFVNNFSSVIFVIYDNVGLRRPVSVRKFFQISEQLFDTECIVQTVDVVL